MPEFKADGPGEHQCHNRYEMCVLDEQAAKLEIYLRASIRWMKEAEIGCRGGGENENTVDSDVPDVLCPSGKC